MKIKILIIEDNPLIQLGYKRALGDISDFEIVAIVSNGKEGLVALEEKDPDVILCDLNMPIMDGFEFTRQSMMKNPKPILIVSDLVHSENDDNIFKVLQYGAVDVLAKPKVGGDIQLLRQELEKKIRVLKGVIVFTKRENFGPSRFTNLENSEKKFENRYQTNKIKRILIGASTGGPQAFHSLFSELPENFPLPILSVQHISLGFAEGLVEWLNHSSKLSIKSVGERELVQKGVIYFPKDDHHLVLQGNTVSVEMSDSYSGHRPSVNKLFDSISDKDCESTLAILLTGMGDDGAKGLKRILDFGGTTITQDENSSVVYGMPRVAKEIGAAKYIMNLSEISKYLIDLGKISLGN